MEEFLQTEAFAKYRQAVLVCFAEYMADRLFGSSDDLREIKGGMEVIRRIINLPFKIRKNDYTKMMVYEDMKRFEAKLITTGLQPHPEKEAG